MKRIFALLALLAVTYTGFAQKIVSTQNLSDFNKIELTGRLQVELVQGDEASVEITLNNAEDKKLDWGIKNGVLSVRLKPGGGSSANADVKITYKDLVGLKVSSANVAVTNTIESPMLDMDISGGATVKADVDLNDLKVTAGGNSVLDLSGETKYYNLAANTKATVDSRSMKAENVVVKAATAASVYVYSSERIEITAATTSTVFYKGTPEIVRQKNSLGGEIHSIGE